MSSPLPPDPYLALGVTKDATAAAIKTQYRKLVLKFHPDKVQDESQKQAAADQFHKVQTAYEIVGDEDRRARYDAQCKLAELKKDVMERGGRGPVDVRTAAYKVPTEAPRSAAFYARGPERVERVSPLYEERKPAYASDYFDAQPPRPTARKEAEYERSTTSRNSPRDDRERVKAYARESKESKESKESERARQSDKSRRRERERVKDRDRKVYADEVSSSGDEYERQSRRMREEDDGLRRQRAQYHETARRQKEDAMHGYYDGDERARKLYTQYEDAKEAIQRNRRPDSERRLSPQRVSSTKDRAEYIRRGDGRPAAVRRSSNRPKMTGRDAESHRSSTREGERRPSPEIVEEPRRPPPLKKSDSSPPDFPRPGLGDRQRSQSVQIEKDDREELPPKFKRSETMPHPSTTRDRESAYRKDAAHQKVSGLRQTEIVDGQPTPGPTPGEWSGPNTKYKYHSEYADDNEIPTTDGYRTEVREPGTVPPRPRYARSPSPMAKGRTNSARFVSPQRPPQPSRTTSTSYVYTPGQGVEAYKPAASRENSGRDRLFYGEIPASRSSPKPTSYSKYSPPSPPEGVRYQREIRPEDIKVQSGYDAYSSRRPTTATRPSYSRQGSSTVYVK